MKRLLLIFLTMAILISSTLCFVSCNKTENKDPGEEQNSNDTNNEDVPLTATLTVAGNDLSNYKIIYARSEYYKAGPKTFTTEYDFYRLIATDIRYRLYEITGVSLDVAQDEKTAEGEYEILVGPTNRAQSDIYDKMSVYDYRNTVSSAKLTIGGGYNSSSLVGGVKTSYSWASTNHAFDYLKEHIASEVKSGKTTVDLAEGFNQKGSADLITVACIGDSITDGAGSSDRNLYAYPAVLQRHLWKDHVVLNYGYSGRTMRNDLADKYKGTTHHTFALKNAQRFDIALIMLGTNDSNRDRSFSADDDASFNDSALELAKELTKKNSDLKLTIMNCPVYYGTDEFGNAHVRQLQKKLTELLEQSGYDSEFFDMYSFTKEELTVTRFPDKLHPNNEGYAIMAERLSRLIPELLGEEAEG